MARRRFICLCLAVALGAAEKAPAEDISAAVIGLRSGYDSNPADVDGGRASAVLTQYARWDFLRGSDKDGFGVALNLANTVYDPRALAPTLNNEAAFKHAMGLSDALLLRSTVVASNEQTWSRRRNSLSWRERLDYENGAWRLFLGAEATVASLNERNIFALGGFLPRDETLATASLLPGAAWRAPFGEIGVSLAASRTRYLNGKDYIGFSRHNDRVTPNLFGSLSIRGVSLEGSISAFNAIFPDKDFENVRRILYTAKATIPYDRFTLSLSSQRAALDTTLPFSVINISSLHEGRLSAKLNEKNTLDVFARYKTDDYLGLDARAATFAGGVEYQRALGDGLTAIAAASWRRTVETGLDPVNALNLQVGLQKQFDIGAARAGADEKRAAGRK
ncbi:MAG: hypothetical protein BGP06_03100 [Rhizobiales bacterium 65-9]|nr:hypothetical protein [Hyphomicrobiales bacterium]OJY35846.1 MAG: hypothetical protein BGP06_03100 [Rhizobiales bacterium 65-9]